jgi:nitroreductase
VSLSAHEVNQLKVAPATDGVLPQILHRWSPRSFTAQEVTPAELKTLFEAARWTASSYNEQPWRYIVGTRNSETFNKILGTLMEFNQAWAKSAAVLVLGVAKTKFSHNGAPNRVALYDLGAASSYLTLQASTMGLHTHQMAGFDEAAALKAFGIPEGWVCGAVIAIGHQGEPDALPHEQMKAQEVAPRTRKALNEFVLSSWDEPAELG